MKTNQKQPQLVLASASPRRRELLEQAQIPFQIQVSQTEEFFLPNETPEAGAMRLALEKAKAVAKQGLFPENIILGADTIVVLDSIILGKPRDHSEARYFLEKLSGRTHRVITGYALIQVSGTILLQNYSETAVHFRALSAAEIREYVQTGESLDKAGGYAAQGGAKKFISSIDGLLSNVIGLPIEDLLPWFQKLGIHKQH